MEYTEFQRLFLETATENGIKSFEEETLQQFYTFTTHLLKVNQITNLTAIRNVPDVIAKHLIDSLFALEYIPSNARVLDLGCGPGFPSIPLAIARPDLQIVALDSTAKKITFVNEAVELLKLPNTKGVSGRAEDPAIRKNLGQFDVVTSRAVARLSILSELCLPYVKIGGNLLALKAAKAEEELAEAQNAIKILGGGAAKTHSKHLIAANQTTEPRCLIEIPKTKQTPPAYPRAYAAILKKPL